MEKSIIQEYCLKNNITRDQFWFRFPHLRQELDILENHIRDQECRKLSLFQKKNLIRKFKFEKKIL